MGKIVKKLVVYLMVGIMQAGFCGLITEASPRHNDPPPKQQQNLHQHDQESDKVNMPFKWYERRENFSPEHHKMERIDDKQFKKKFSQVIRTDGMINMVED